MSQLAMNQADTHLRFHEIEQAPKLDWMGRLLPALPALCFVHCMASALLMLVLPAAASLWSQGEWLEAPLWLLSMAVPLLAAAGPLLYLASAEVWTLWLPVLLVYIGLPIADLVVGEDRSNPPDAVMPELDADPYYRVIAWMMVPLLWIAFVFAAWGLDFYMVDTDFTRDGERIYITAGPFQAPRSDVPAGGKDPAAPWQLILR